MAATTATGTLQIGDQWNAITIIAHSQTHPLKAICELTENALDAGATSVRIVRRRQQGEIFLEVVDDGRGVAPAVDGRPDFARIATHLCDSMKRHLDARGRKGVHGEFGIGLLSFWSLGAELRMISADADGGLHEMVLARGRREYVIQPLRGRLPTGGTRVIVGPLLDATRNLVTGEKLTRYLSAELRDRIRATGVRLTVSDRVARRELVVTPREFDGERLEVPRRYPTPLGDVQVELYLRGESAAAGAIALCKDGTRVLKEIAELLPFQKPPWTDGRLEGLVDFEPLTLAPGTRSGVVPDAAYDALVAVAPNIEADVIAGLADREKAESERASRQILRQVHKAFTTALSELPSEEYLFFDIPRAQPAAEAGEGLRGEPLSDTRAEDPAPVEQPPGQPVLFPPEPGPLAAVRIVPRRPRRKPGAVATLTAVALDASGVVIPAGVTFTWRLVSGVGEVEAAGSRCRVNAGCPGVATVEVAAVQASAEGADRTATAQVEVQFHELAIDDDGPSAARGLPGYRLEAEHGQPWRSRYDAAGNVIVINSAHRDFLASRVPAARHRRYIGKLYAKEVVLSNFPHESPADVLERLIELTLRTEESL